MTRLAAALIGLATFALLGCGSDDTASGVTATDATAAIVSTDGDARVADVSMTLRSAGNDKVTTATVDASFAREVTLTASTGTSGGDGHLGHLDPGSGSDHTHDRTVGIDVPADTDVEIAPGGTARIRVQGVVPEPRVGDTFQLTLGFDNAPDITVEVTVADSSPSGLDSERTGTSH